jgi:hypothetical protein
VFFPVLPDPGEGLILSLFGQHLGDDHDRIAALTRDYLYRKSLEILNSGIEIKDLREGEPTLSDLWIRIHTYGMLRENPSLKTLDKETLTRRVVEIHPVPAEFDFRVNLD